MKIKESCKTFISLLPAYCFVCLIIVFEMSEPNLMIPVSYRQAIIQKFISLFTYQYIRTIKSLFELVNGKDIY